MRYRESGSLDTSGVRDTRGGGGLRGGRGVAVGGGGLGLVGLVVVVLLQVLGGGDGGGAAAGAFSGLGQDQTVDNSTLQENCRTGADANESVECAVVADVESIQDYWTGLLGDQYAATETVFFTGSVQTSCGACHQRVGAVLLPGRPAGLHRPDLLRPAPRAVRRAGRSVRRRLRASPTSTATTCRTCSASTRGYTRRERAHQRLGPAGAAGRLLRRRLGEPRGDRARRLRRAADRRDHRRRHRPGPRRRRPHRRRLHPGEPRQRPGGPGGVHPRELRAAAALVPGRLRVR